MTADDRCGHGIDAGAYALDALEPGERDAFERHLLTCPACRREVRELRVAADALPLAAEQLAPPPELKDRLMSVVRREAALLSAAGPDADLAIAPSRDERGPEPSVPARTDRPSWRRRIGALKLRPLPAAALAAVLLALGVAGGVLLARGGDRREYQARVTVPGASARLTVEGDHGRLAVRRLPAPPSGRVYQVWVLRKDTSAPAPTDALFRTTRDGRASVDVPGTLQGVRQVLVTSEPDGGSAAPTSKPVVIATTS